ncbi:MAG: hypothetical protein AB7G87_09925 [Clostridia bacterium]
MGKDWTKEELQQASKAMKSNGHMGYEEFCKQLTDGVFNIESTDQTAETTETEVRS